MNKGFEEWVRTGMRKSGIGNSWEKFNLPVSTSLESALLWHRPQLSHIWTHANWSCTSMFHQDPWPDSCCCPSGLLTLPLPLISAAWPPTLHAVRDYPTLLPCCLSHRSSLFLCPSFFACHAPSFIHFLFYLFNLNTNTQREAYSDL